ncbi:class II fructose-bisphosphate aldolase [Candidatus Hakubella thermalkaliphila]|nr:class II fructose-bisphosphate aldolase [Candidatus Hakubella thermalkaliphila]
MPNLLAEAEKGADAVGYVEGQNLESLEAVMDAAEETRSPVILGFGGGFLENPQRADSPRLGLYAALGLAAARTTTVPVCLP